MFSAEFPAVALVTLVFYYKREGITGVRGGKDLLVQAWPALDCCSKYMSMDVISGLPSLYVGRTAEQGGLVGKAIHIDSGGT